MKMSLVTMLFSLLAGAGTAYAGTDKIPISLEYCPSTPTPINARGAAPGALTAKFAHDLAKEFKLYIGTGLAYTLPAPEEGYRGAGGPETGLKTGLAGQAGIDLKLGEHTSLFLDYKYLHLAQDAPRGNNEASPQLFGIRLNCSF